MKKSAALLIAFILCTQLHAQNDVENYGPFGAVIYTDLKEALKSTKKVFKLDLSYQPIDPKLYDKISGLGDLQVLKLGSNIVTNYPQHIEKLINLVYFASYNNKLVRFLPQLRSYPNLFYLELQNTEIDSIPAQIAYLSNLKTFKFGNTDDTLKLPTTFKYLKKLSELSFENCVLDSLPKQIFMASGLRFLSLSNTNTNYLSKHFERVPNLEVLIVENNPLREVPFEIYKAKNLRVISFRGTKISRLPDSISQLEHLTLLDLRGTTCSEEELEKLRILLPGCQIKF